MAVLNLWTCPGHSSGASVKLERVLSPEPYLRVGEDGAEGWFRPACNRSGIVLISSTPAAFNHPPLLNTGTEAEWLAWLCLLPAIY